MIKKVLYNTNGNKINKVQYWTGRIWITEEEFLERTIAAYQLGAISHRTVIDQLDRVYQINLDAEIRAFEQARYTQVRVLGRNRIEKHRPA